MVHVLGAGHAADRAHATLDRQENVKLLLPNAITPLQVIVARAAMVLNFVLTATLVMTRLAIAAPPVTGALVSRKVL